MAEILLIDDDNDLRAFLQSALAERGHRIHPLDCADHALDFLAHGEFDLVVVDQNMPRMLGSDFLEVLRDKQIDLPAILMTGMATGSLKPRMKELGVLVIPKPSAGYGELMKDLAPALDEALHGESEIIASIARTVNLALKLGKTGLVPYLRWLLYRELLVRVSTEVKHNAKEAKRILGVPLTELDEEKPTISFRMQALLLIAEHPELKATQYADRLGVSRATLYRDPDIKRALKRKNASTDSPPRGSKNAEGDIEAWDE